MNWIKNKECKPPRTGIYMILCDHNLITSGRYNKGFLNLPWLCYWSEEKYTSLNVISWTFINERTKITSEDEYE